MIQQLYLELRQWLRGTYQSSGARGVQKDMTAQYAQTSVGFRRLLIVAAILLVAVIAYYFVYSVVNTPKIARALGVAVPVNGLKVHVDDITNTIGASGVIHEHATINSTSLVSASVINVLVNIGDIVKKGQQLIDIDKSSYEPALVSAQQQEIAAKIGVEKDTAILKATQALKKESLAEEVDIQTAASALATASQQEAQAQQGVAVAKRNLDFTHLASPVNGIVITRSVDPGDMLTMNTAVFTLGDLDTVYFEALVQEDDLPFLDKGAPADIVFSSLPMQTFHGAVEKIDPTVDATTRTFNAYIAIKNPDLVLKPGITGFGRIMIKRTGLAIPQTAVMNQFGESASVFVVNNDHRAIITPVRLGLLSSDGVYEVISGLKEGDVVVSVGTLYLKDNERVHVTFPSGKS